MKKYSKLLFFTFILLTIILFINPLNVKGITLSSITYTFKNDNLYNSTNIEFNNTNNVNVRNQTYYNGTYPATYSFTNDIIGNNPIDFNIDENGGTVNVIRVLGGHRNIVELHDNNTSDLVSMSNDFPLQTSGTVEFWIRVSDASPHTFIQLFQGGALKLYFAIRIENLYYNTGGPWTQISAINDDIWYHIRIDFDCTTDTFNVYIDNVLEVNDIPFFEVADNISNFKINSGTAESGFYSYLDALGYTWNISDYVEILDFSNDIVGNEPIGWNSANEGSCTTTIKDALDGRTKVLDLFDEGGVGTEANIRTDLENSIKNFVEMDITKNTTEGGVSYLYFMENDVNIVELAIIHHDLKYFDESYKLIKTSFYTPDIFVVLRIEFNFTTDTINVYINDVLEGNNLAFKNVGNTEIDELIFFTDDSDLRTFHIYIDNIGIDDNIPYVIGSNIIPLIETNPFYEVDTFEFDMVNPNILYDIGTDNPSGWNDIENGYDHTNIAQDNTDISGGSRINHRVVEIEGIGATHEITGIEKSFDIINGIINISMNYNFTEVSNNQGAFNISIYSNNLDLQVKITLDFPNPTIFGADLKYYDGSEYIILENYTTFHENQDIEYSIYIDSFVIFRASTNGSLGYNPYNYTFPLINSSNKGLGKIEIVSDTADDSGNDNIACIKNVGVYSNSTSLSDDFGYLPLRIIDDNTFWIYLAHNLFRINANGIFAMHTASYDDWIFGGNMEVLSGVNSYNNTLEVINLYFTEFVHFPPTGIFDPIIVFFIKSQFNISSITIDGIKFFDDTPHDFGFASYSSGGVDNNKSYFFIDEVNKVQYRHYTDQNGINEFIQMEFVVGGISTNSSAVQFSTTKSRGAFGFFRVKYVSTSSIFEIPIISKTTTSILPNDKSIISYIVLITDNNDNTISGLTTGSISKFTLLFTDDIITQIITTSLLAVLIPLIIILIPSLAFRVRYGKFMLVPFFLLMSIMCVIGGVIPTWLFFIIVLSLSLFILQKNEVEV